MVTKETKMALGFGKDNNGLLKQISDLITPQLEEIKSWVAEVKAQYTEIKSWMAEVFSRLSQVDSRLDKLEQELSSVKQELSEQRSVNSKFQAKVLEDLGFLVAELSRYKGDSDQMLLSIYAFCTIYGLPFSYGDLSSMGRKATRESRRRDATVESTADPRFGTVNLYEPRVLEDLFLPEEE